VAGGDDPDALFVVQRIQQAEKTLARHAEGVVDTHGDQGLHGGAASGRR
jgi:hypothetical protein